VNAWENDNGLILEAEMPGATPESVEVAVEGSELTLKGTRPVHGEGKGQPFERRFDLPFDVDSGAVQAKFRNGMLTLALPKAASARRRQIAVQAA
jgi:HSP20 family protein